MKKMISRIRQTYFAPTLELRVQLFNVLGMVSACFCLVIAVINAFAGIGIAGVLVDLAAAAFCVGLVVYASRSGRAQLCHIITITGCFLILFPYLFFKMGGYKGGVPCFLIFAVVFTVFMMEGTLALIFTALELTVYTGMYFYAYRYPASVTVFPDEKGLLVSNLMDLLIVGVALGATMYAQVRVYRRQQSELDEQNAVLAQVNRAKTEFLANTSHEMRTPLTVISVNVQAVNGILQHMNESVTDPEVTELLADAQEEVMRLSRMVGGMLTLASVSERTEKSRVDLTALYGGVSDMMRLTLSKNGNALQAEIGKNLTVFGDADLLSQVAVNLIQNAHAHTENGTIGFTAGQDAGQVTMTVSDNGSGIPPELLPRVFERGVTDGGTGLGLFLCKTVAESHGGKISIASELGKGTTVTFTLPAYQGQYGDDAS